MMFGEWRFVLDLTSIQAAESHMFDIQPVSASVQPADFDNVPSHNVPVVCTGSALVYGLDLFMPYNDESDRYSIFEDSIRLGARAAGNKRVPTAAELAVQYYAGYPEELGEAWSMELVVNDNESDPATSLAREPADEGITVIGPSGSGSVSALKEFTGSSGMLVSSSCSADSSPSVPDHVFRTAPDDANRARALAALTDSDGVNAAVVVCRDDPYGGGPDGAPANAMAPLGGRAAVRIHYSAAEENLNTESLAERVADAIKRLADANETKRVGIAAVSSTGIVGMTSLSMPYDIPGDVRRYVSESAANPVSLTRCNPGEFELVGLSGVVMWAPPNPFNEDIAGRPDDGLGLLPGESPDICSYSVYGNVAMLCNSMLAAQTSESGTLTGAVCHVSARTFGSLSDNVLNENGYLTFADRGMWRVADGLWMQTGTYLRHADRIVHADGQ